MSITKKEFAELKEATNYPVCCSNCEAPIKVNVKYHTTYKKFGDDLCLCSKCYKELEKELG